MICMHFKLRFQSKSNPILVQLDGDWQIVASEFNINPDRFDKFFSSNAKREIRLLILEVSRYVKMIEMLAIFKVQDSFIVRYLND